MIEILKNISWRSLRVWQRNGTVYIATWFVNFVTPILEPLFYLSAFGLGLGQLVKSVDYNGMKVSYLVFITPGLISTVIMNYAFFETTYASFVRMYFQKTYDAILATPLLIEDVVAGELLWGATKSALAGVIMMVVVSCFKLLVFPVSFWIIPLSFVGGLVFSSLGMLFTSMVKTIEQFNFPIFLYVTPMFLFSGVFFPLTALPDWAQKIAYVFPLTYLVVAVREISTGKVNYQLPECLIVLAILGMTIPILSIILMKKRLIK